MTLSEKHRKKLSYDYYEEHFMGTQSVCLSVGQVVIFKLNLWRDPDKKKGLIQHELKLY